MYPTTMEDANGNQVLIRYFTGVNRNHSQFQRAHLGNRRCTRNSSRRRRLRQLSFYYNSDTPAHLTSITNTISTGENYTFSLHQPNNAL